MILLDMRTIIFSYVLTDIVCLVVIVLLWRQNRKRFEGTIFWMFDFAFQTAALFLIVLRGSIPDWMSMVLANTLAITGALLGYMGLTRFVGKKSPQIHNYIFLAVFVCVHAYFTFVQPDQAVRNLNTSLGLLVMCFQCAWLLLYRVKSGFRQLTRNVSIVFSIYCLISIFRIVEFFTGAHSKSDYLQAGAFEQIVLIAYQMLFILLTYSLALMFNKRLLSDISTQEEKFSKAFHSSPYAVTLTRLSDGRIIEANDGFLKMTGYSHADIKGKTTIDLNLWPREADRAAIISELSSNGKVHERELPFRKKSGEMSTGLLSSEVITVSNDHCVLSSINDITKRKSTEEELRETSGYLNSLIDYANAPIITWDAKLIITRFNHAFEKLTGYAAIEMVGRNLQILFPEESRNESLRKIALTSSGELWESVEIPVQRKDGDIRVALWNSANILDQEGNIISTIAQGQDITERKRAEEAIRQSEERYRHLFTTLIEGFCIIEMIFDAQGGPIDYRFLEINPSFEKQCGLIQAQGKLMRSLAPNHEAYWFEIFGKVATTGEPVHFENEAKELNRWFDVSAFHVGGPKVAILFNDITARKRAEGEFLRLNIDLEQKIAERTRELRNSQGALLNLVDDLNQTSKDLASSNDALEAVNKELTAFSYSVSHDLRAPLRSIDGFSQALLEDYAEKFDDTGRNFLGRIRKATQHMGHLIDDILKLSRVTRADFNLKSVNLSEMVGSIVQRARQNDPNRKIEWRIQEGLCATADRNLLEIALVNLMNNAVKFTSKNAQAKIEFGAVEKQGRTEYYIRDNGAGFDMAYVDKLFGTFQRLHSTEEFEGTGIGLATVMRIFTRHGGTIRAEGKVGKGATFFFTLQE